MAGLTIERLPEYAELQGSCWVWFRFRNERGYGVHSRHGRLAYAHRTVYELMVGPVPDGLELDHLCRNKPCVNPDHLEPVPHWVNIQRAPTAIATMFAKRTTCNHGHPYTPENTIISQGYRKCRECKLVDERRRYYANKAVAS